MRTKFAQMLDIIKVICYILLWVLVWVLLVYFQVGEKQPFANPSSYVVSNASIANMSRKQVEKKMLLSTESVSALGGGRSNLFTSEDQLENAIMNQDENYYTWIHEDYFIGDNSEIESVFIITASPTDNLVAVDSVSQKNIMPSKVVVPAFESVSITKRSIIPHFESGNKIILDYSESSNLPLPQNIDSINAHTSDGNKVVVLDGVESASLLKAVPLSIANANLPLPERYTKDLIPGLLSINVNQNAEYSEPKLVLNNESAICIESSLFSEFRIDPKMAKSFSFTDSSTFATYLCFVQGVDQIKITYDRLKGAVSLDLPGYMLQKNNIPLSTSGQPPNNEEIQPLDVIYSNNTNYQFQGLQNMQGSVNSNQFAAIFSNTTSTPLGSLISNLSYLDNSGWQRDSAYWQTDYLVPMTSLLIGDIAPNSGVWGGGSTLGGVQYGTNTALRPYANFVATPTINGVVDQPSQMDVLLDGNSITPLVAIPAGAYNVYNLPVINGDGTLTVNLKNSQGAVIQSLTMPYFTAPQVLQKGTYFYQYNLGLPPSVNMAGVDWGYQTNQPAFSTQHSYAFSDYYTMDIHSEAQSGNFYNFGLNHNFNLFNTLYSGFYTALSQAESGGNGGSAGVTLARLANKVNTLGASYSYGVSSQQFATLGYTPGQTSSNQVTQNFSISYATDFSLSLGLGYTSNSGIVGGGVSIYSGNMTYQPFTGSSLMLQAAQTSFGSNNSLSVILSFTYALKSGSISSSYQVNDSPGASNSIYNLGYQYFDPTNTWGYNLNEQYMTQTQQANTLGAGGYYAFKNFNTNANAAYTDSNTYSTNGSLTGNMIIASNGVNLARSSSGSFAIVKVGSLPNIGIMLGDTYIGSTDHNGEFTVPNIQAYVPQQIKVRATDLPINTELDSYSKNLIAPLNGGVMLVFKVVHYTPATLSLRYNDDQIPPVGYTATLFNSETKEKVENLIIIDNGMVMISKFSPAVGYYIEFTVKSGSYSCSVTKDNIDGSASNDYQYVLRDIKCTLKP